MNIKLSFMKSWSGRWQKICRVECKIEKKNIRFLMSTLTKVLGQFSHSFEVCLPRRLILYFFFFDGCLKLPFCRFLLLSFRGFPSYYAMRFFHLLVSSPRGITMMVALARVKFSFIIRRSGWWIFLMQAEARIRFNFALNVSARSQIFVAIAL